MTRQRPTTREVAVKSSQVFPDFGGEVTCVGERVALHTRYTNLLKIACLKLNVSPYILVRAPSQRTCKMTECDRFSVGRGTWWVVLRPGLPSLACMRIRSSRPQGPHRGSHRGLIAVSSRHKSPCRETT